MPWRRPLFARTSRTRPRLEALEGRVAPAAILATAPGPDGGPHVRVFDPRGAPVAEFLAYDPSFSGGVRVASGDLTGDGVDDLVTAPGLGGGPHVKAFDGAALLHGVVRELYGLLAYDPGFTGGVSVAAADVTGDGLADIVTGAGPGGGPHVQVFDGATGRLVRSFQAYDPGFRGGVTVAAGDTDADGRADVVTAPGSGGGPHVKVFDGCGGGLAAEWLAYDPGFNGGLSVAVGNVTGSARAQVITGPGPGGGPVVRAFDGPAGRLVTEFSAYDPGFRGGVAVASADLDADGAVEVLTAPGAGGGPDVRAFAASGGLRLALSAYAPAFRGGVAVAGVAPVNPDAAVTRSFDFHAGAQGWAAGFADLPAAADPAFYQLDAGVRPLPAELGPGSGFVVQGDNHSDDLFMYLKRRLGPADGVRPGQAYRVRFSIRFGSNAPTGGFGVGGAPGEGVSLKAGAGAEEPRAVPVGGALRMNVDKGDQSFGGRDAGVVGDIANGRPPAVPPAGQAYVAVARAGTLALPARSNAPGSLWVLVGTDSGFEGLTRLYYLGIAVTLLPLEAGP